MARQDGYVDVMVKRPVKVALQDSMKYGETYGQAILRLISFYKKNSVGPLDQEPTNTTSEITPPTTSEGSLHNV
ncbi:MAG: hypothetical protein KGI19_09590 [Thaumarchaeota archaeon]|nr:hypothetical protein [Nitrososphaerota archaeon]